MAEQGPTAAAAQAASSVADSVPVDGPGSLATPSVAAAGTPFPFLGTPMATLILDWIPQRQLGPVRQACASMLEATRQLTFSSYLFQPDTRWTPGPRAYPPSDTSLLIVGGPTLSLVRYCTLFPGAAKVGVMADTVTEEEAPLLRRFCDVSIVGRGQEDACEVSDALVTAIADRGPGQPPLRRLAVKHCTGLTNSAFASLPQLQELVLWGMGGALDTTSLSLPASLLRLTVKEIDDWRSTGRGGGAGGGGASGRPWSFSVLNGLHALQRLDWEVDAPVVSGMDLAQTCPCLQRVDLVLRLPTEPHPDLALGVLPAITWAGLPQLHHAHVRFHGMHGAHAQLPLDRWLAGLQTCSQLGEIGLHRTSLGRADLVVPSLPLPPSVHTLTLSGMRVPSQVFLLLPGLRELMWYTVQGMDREIDLAEACPLLEDVSISVNHLTLLGLPRVTWGKLTQLRKLFFTLSLPHTEPVPKADAGVNYYLSGLPKSLEVLRVRFDAEVPLPLLTHDDIADLPRLRELQLGTIDGLTGAQPARLPALETLSFTHAPPSLQSLAFVSRCERLRKVCLRYCDDLQPQVLAALPASLRRLDLVGCRLMSEAQARAACPQVPESEVTYC